VPRAFCLVLVHQLSASMPCQGHFFSSLLSMMQLYAASWPMLPHGLCCLMAYTDACALLPHGLCCLMAYADACALLPHGLCCRSCLMAYAASWPMLPHGLCCLMAYAEARGGGKRALGPSSLNSMPSRSVKSSPPSHRSMNMLHVQADSRTWKETATYMLQSDANIHALQTPTRPTNTYTPTCKQTGRT
jgi:hypothetical protein